MKAVFGYLLAGLGLLALAANSTIGRENLKFLENVDSAIVLGVAAVLIVVGVVIMIVNSKGGIGGKIRQVASEVPIYEGDGKKRKIVGYKVE